MSPIVEAALELSNFMHARGWRFCVIGGLALQRWGEPRSTVDVDVNLLVGFGSEAPFIDALLEAFTPRVSDAAAFALRNRVLLLQGSNGVGIDVALGALPFEECMIERASPVEFAPGVEISCCSAEDLFIMKAFASRPRDWLDLEMIITRSNRLDQAYILSHLEDLCALKEAPEIVERAKKLLGIEP